MVNASLKAGHPKGADATKKPILLALAAGAAVAILVWRRRRRRGGRYRAGEVASPYRLDLGGLRADIAQIEAQLDRRGREHALGPAQGNDGLPQ